MSLYDHPELYDRLFPVEPHCVQFYSELARNHGAAVLELACGTGQLTVPVAGLGCPVAGIDNSPAMIEAAKQRAAAAGVAVAFSLADMRQFDLDRKFSLIFVARSSLLHLTTTKDLQACLDAVRRHLSDDGVFAFDIFNPDVARLSRTKSVMSVGGLTVEETSGYDAATQVNHSTWSIESQGTFPLHLRVIFPQELPLLVRSSGLDIQNLFGDFDRSPFSSESPRQIIVCGKRPYSDISDPNPPSA